MTKEYKNVLIARFSALGDVAMTVPVVYSACEAYPTVRFVIATQPVASSLFVNPPQNLTVVGVDVKQRYKGTHGIWRLMGDLRREYAIDAFIDLHDVIRTHIMGVYCRMHGIPMSRIDKGRSEKRELTRETGKNLHPLISTRQRYFDAVCRHHETQIRRRALDCHRPVCQARRKDISPRTDVARCRHLVAARRDTPVSLRRRRL